MPSPKKQSEAVPTQDPSTTLIAAVRGLTDQLETLTHEVGQLAGRAQVLTEAIDDVRSELEWAIRNLHDPPPRLIGSAPQEDHESTDQVVGAKPLPGKPNCRAPKQRDLWE